jgi:hypothetical protein
LILVVKLVSPQVSCKARFVRKVEKMNQKGAILRRENNFEISWANISCVGASLEELWKTNLLWEFFCKN